MNKVLIGIALLSILFLSGCVDKAPNTLTKIIQSKGDINLTQRTSTAPIKQFCSDIGMEYIIAFDALGRDSYYVIPRCLDKNNEMHFFVIDADEDNLFWYIGNMTYEMDIEVVITNIKK